MRFCGDGDGKKDWEVVWTMEGVKVDILCARATGESNCQSGVSRVLNGCVDVELEVS
jgi:hypothetical protein